MILSISVSFPAVSHNKMRKKKSPIVKDVSRECQIERVDLYEIKEMLGHASVTTTQIYAHLQPERLHATVNRISLPPAGPEEAR